MRKRELIDIHYYYYYALQYMIVVATKTNTKKKTVKVERMEALETTCTEGTPDRNADLLGGRIASS